MFVLEVYIRRDRKEGTGKREQERGTRRHTQECCVGQGTVLTPKAGKSAALAHSGGCGFPPSLIHTNKAPTKKGDFSGYRKTKG